MHLSLSARFTLKNTPKGHRGLVSEHVTWAKNAAMTFFGLAQQVLGEILDWYSLYSTPEDLEKGRDQLVEWLQGIHFVAPEEEKGDDDGGKDVR